MDSDRQPGTAGVACKEAGAKSWASGFEGKKHIRKMLDRTRQTLTDTELDQIVNGLKE